MFRPPIDGAFVCGVESSQFKASLCFKCRLDAYDSKERGICAVTGPFLHHSDDEGGF